MTGPHLTEEEFDDLLLGDGAAHAQAHLETCEQCATRMHRFAAVVQDFNHASLAWASAKSNTISRDLAQVDRGRQRTGFAPAWASTLAGLAVLAAAVTAGMHLHEQRSTQFGATPMAQTAAARSDDSAGDIARDNEMLRAIDSAINTPVPSPEQWYEPAAAGVRRPPRALRILD